MTLSKKKKIDLVQILFCILLKYFASSIESIFVPFFTYHPCVPVYLLKLLPYEYMVPLISMVDNYMFVIHSY